ncbi:MAG: sporulation protein [Chloroflexota bacterium]
MNVDEMLSGARDTMTVKRVYGDPIERDGVLVIPAAKVAGGGGGGGDSENNAGGGFGVRATPAGAWIIRDGQVAWEPAVDATRLATLGMVVAIVFLLTVRSIAKANARAREKSAKR